MVSARYCIKQKIQHLQRTKGTTNLGTILFYRMSLLNQHDVTKENIHMEIRMQLHVMDEENVHELQIFRFM